MQKIRVEREGQSVEIEWPRLTSQEILLHFQKRPRDVVDWIFEALGKVRGAFSPAEFPVDAFALSCEHFTIALEGANGQKVADIAIERFIPRRLGELQALIGSAHRKPQPPPATLTAGASEIFANPEADTAVFHRGDHVGD